MNNIAKKNNFLGMQIKNAMHERGLKGADLCKLINVTPSALSNYINSRREPSFLTLTRIANVLGKPLEYFSYTHKLESESVSENLNNLVSFIRQNQQPVRIELITAFGIKSLEFDHIVFSEMLTRQNELVREEV